MDPFDHQVLNLTPDFYSAYPATNYPEILSKPSRPYNCLLIKSHYGYYICIPYRSQINHPYAFMFRHSRRSKRTRSGLDYTKIVIITNPDYITSNDAIVDRDEYAETRTYINRIKSEVIDFIDDYVEHFRNPTNMSAEEFNRKYSRSSLQYFHKELGINSNRPLS